MGLEPEEFSMFMRFGPSTIHTYTSTQKTSQSERYRIYDMKHLYGQYPALAELPADQLKYGKILALEATLNLHKPEQLKKGCDLGILFAFRGRPMYQPPSVVCHTKLYNNGMRIVHTNDVIQTAREGVYVKPDIDNVDVVELDDKTIQYAVPFRSTFWAPSLYRLANMAHEADTLALNSSDGDSHKRVQTLRHEVLTSISNITAVQELVAMHRSCSAPQTVLTIHWSFEQAVKGQKGLTTRRVLEISDLFNEPTPTSAHTSTANESFNSLDVFDFSQPVEPYFGTSTALQSPIQFPTDANAWTTPGCSNLGVPSSTNMALQCTNEIDFTGGHIALTFDDTQHAAQPFMQPFDTSATSALGLDMTALGDMPTDPLLLSQYTRPWNTGFESLFDTPTTAFPNDTAFHAPIPIAAMLPSQHDHDSDTMAGEMEIHTSMPTHGQFEVAYRNEFGNTHGHHQGFAGASASEAEIEQHLGQVRAEMAEKEMEGQDGQQGQQQQIMDEDEGHGCTRCTGLGFCACVPGAY